MKCEILPGSDTSFSELIQRITKIERLHIEAGYLSNAPHPKSELGMVEIAAIQQFGSTSHNIPERPFLTDGAVISVEDINKHWKQVFHHYLTGKGIAAFEPVAKASREAIAKAITAQKFVALSPVTLRIRRKKGSNSTKILIDSAYLINAIESKITME